MHDIAMHRLSDSMEEGTIIGWLVENGHQVSVGQELVEIETDKAAVTQLADSEGVLEILVPAGTKCPVGALIARLRPAGASVGDPQRSPADRPAHEASPPSGAPPPQRTAQTDVAAAAARAPSTPLARRAAAIHGVNLDRVAATGPRGRVTHSDVLAAAAISSTPSPATAPQSGTKDSPQETPIPGSNGWTELDQGDRPRKGLSPIQRLIAERMVHATTTIPAFQVQSEVNFERVVALRHDIKAVSAGGAAPSLNDFIVKAVALALKDFPKANASYTLDGFEYHGRINIGVAVAAEGILVVPTVFDADIKSLGTIAAESRLLAERVRSATISPSELSGGTFTVSNLGMYGMTAITPVINPPQAAILGVGALRQVLTRTGEGDIGETSVVTLTLSCDHRILYGAEAAEFLGAVRVLLETPLRLAL